jgi:hypothetical protein
MQNIVDPGVGTTEQADRLLRIHDDVVRSTASSPAAQIFPLNDPTSI